MSSPPCSPASSAARTTDDAARAAAERLDGQLHAATARLTAGLSPVALSLAFTDWALNLATQPAQAARLAMDAQQRGMDWWAQALADGAAPAADPRFAAPAWQQWPWNALASGHQAVQDWWHDAAALRGMSAHHVEMTRFGARQWLDMLAPSNAGLLNPEVQERTRQRRGANLAAGAAQAVDAWRRSQGLAPLQPPPREHRPGTEVALTPGKVVLRNHLVELIQYDPATPRVHAEPVLIVPSWIMKYYILDLSPHNSMVRWLVGQGHTVFIVSWRNPDASDALLDMDDYLELGVFETLHAVGEIVPGRRVHACGYCLGGTLMAIAAAALSRPGAVDGASRLPALASVTLLAALTDFAAPGEMGVLIDEAQVAWLEDLMAERGFLGGRQMGGSFAYLHARDLVWSPWLRGAWLGESNPPNDLMSWNADVTRMPAAMHSQYLRRCFLRNEIATGRYPVQGRPVSLADLRVPLFVVGTERDHVCPWPSVYEVHRLCGAELTFVLASGGHNAGIVSEPGHAGRRHAVALRPAQGHTVAAADWPAQARRGEGSWWPEWSRWLVAQGSGDDAPRWPADAGLGDAPGQYVHVRYDD